MKVLIASFDPFQIKDLAISLKKKGISVDIGIPFSSVSTDSLKMAPSVLLEEGKIRIFKTKFYGLDSYVVLTDQKDEEKDSVFFCNSLCLISDFLSSYEILISHNWHTALLMPYIRQRKIRISCGIFLIPEMRHGFFDLDKGYELGFSKEEIDQLEFYESISLLKVGVIYSDAIVTISPTYAKEIQTPQYGAGIDELMRKMSHKIYGILNGVDYENWDPEKDIFIKKRYSKKDLDKKRICKEDLISEIGISKEDAIDRPIIAMISDLEEDKGFPLVIEAFSKICQMEPIMVVYGTGDPIIESLLMHLKEFYPKRLFVFFQKSHPLLHKVIAGSDMILMPYIFEPCGSMQMYAMRYGTIPIVRATGGLNDTVTDPEEGYPETGFKFYDPDSNEMIKAIERAITTYYDKAKWKRMMLNAMDKRFLWEDTAEEYIKLFNMLLNPRRTKS